MKTIHYLPIAMAIAALGPSACTSSFPAGIDYSGSGGSGGGGGGSGTGSGVDAAGVATGGAVAVGGIAGRGTGGVAGLSEVDTGMVPALGGTAIAGAGGVAGSVGLDASAGGAAGSTTGGSIGCVPAGKTSPLAMLPASNEIGIWALSAAPASVNNDADLYAMIDGAAPKYIDRGWVRSAYATYQQGSGGSTLEVAIHDMGTAENADTLFKVDLPVSRLELATNAVVDMGLSVGYVAHGWTGPYYVEVSLVDRSDAALVYVKTFVLSILNRVCAVGPDAGSTPDAPPASPVFKTVAAGFEAACGLRTDGSVVCWGSRAPAAPPKESFASLDLDNSPCGVKTDGTLVCWDAFSGETLDAKSDGGAIVDGFATPPGSYASVDVGYARICGVKTDGTVACWGYPCSNVESPPAGTFAQVSSGSAWVCGVKTDGALACWNQCLAPPIPTPPSGTFTSVSVGVNFACGVRTGGTLVCWGSGPATPPTGTFLSVSAGNQYACGVKTDGTLACWGDNTYGRATPPSGTFASISTGNEFGCGVRTNGTLACWGNNASGEATPPVY